MPNFGTSNSSLSRRSFQIADQVAFFVLLGAHLVPIWAFHYFISTDGPAHLYNAWVMKALLFDPHNQFQASLAFNTHPEPNYLSHALLVAALTVLPPWLAEKTVLTLYVVGLPLAMRYLLRSWQPAAGFLAVLVFPFVYCAVLQWGFYNYCLGVVGLFWVLGYWKRHLAGAPTLQPRPIISLLLLLTLVFFAHPLVYLVAALLLGLLVIEQLVLAPANGRGWLARAAVQLGALALAFLPTLPLLAWYFWRKGGEGNGAAAPLGVAIYYFKDLLTMEALRYMGPPERPYRMLVAGLLLALLAYTAWRQWRGRALASGWALLVGCGVLIVAYLVLPDALAGGSILRPRLGLLIYLLMVAGLATVPYAGALRWAVLVAGFGMAVAFLGFRFVRFRTLQTGLAEYRSAAAYIRPGSSLASLQFGESLYKVNASHTTYIDVFKHTEGYLAVERNLLNYDNYEAHVGYFPLVWKPSQERISQLDSLPQRIDLAPSASSLGPDYVLVWGAPDTIAYVNHNRRRALAQLRQFYQPVYRSARGLVLLFARRSRAALPLSRR